MLSMKNKCAHVCPRCLGGNLHQDNVLFCCLVFQGKLYGYVSRTLGLQCTSFSNNILKYFDLKMSVSSEHEASKGLFQEYCAWNIYNFCYYCEEIVKRILMWPTSKKENFC